MSIGIIIILKIKRNHEKNLKIH